MQIIHSLHDYKLLCENESERCSGFVPTMGALHEGHLELVRQAKSECETVRVSIFVNPTQFNNPEDFEKYPINLEHDIELLNSVGVDVLWLPNKLELYPDSYQYQIVENKLSPLLCGKSRKGHFEGMLTIVLKLLQLSKAKRAYFGEKDFQQLQLVKGMVEAFFINTKIISCPVIRDESGLPLSSRLQRLSPLGFKKAQTYAKIFGDLDLSLEELSVKLKSIPDLEIDYLEDIENRRFSAVLIEGIRLIDNRAKEQ